MTSRHRARRTTKEDSSSFFSSAAASIDLLLGDSARSRARIQRKRCSYAHVVVSGCAIPSPRRFHSCTRIRCVHALPSPPPPPQASERFTRRVKQMARCVPGRRRSLPVSADHVTMKTHRSVTDGFDCFRIHDEDRQSFLSVIFMTTKTIRSDEERERSIIFPRDGGRRVQKTVRLPLFSSSVS